MKETIGIMAVCRDFIVIFSLVMIAIHSVLGGAKSDDICFKRKNRYVDTEDYKDIVHHVVDTLDKLNRDCVKDNVQMIKSQLDKNLIGLPRDCKAWYDLGKRDDDVYNISTSGNSRIEAYCDMTNGGWTVIQRRINGAINFDRNWANYTQGFGNVKSEHWLGLTNIHDLTNGHESQISIELWMTKTKTNASAVYKGFYIEGENKFFTMHVKPDAIYNDEMRKYIGSHKGLYYHNGMKFSTKDKDNDRVSYNCAAHSNLKSGFWYNGCYTLGGVNSGNIWYKGKVYFSKCELKIRRIN